MSDERFSFLERTRKMFQRIGGTIQQSDALTDTLWEEIEEELLAADVGPHTSSWLVGRLQERVAKEKIRTGSQVYRALREELVGLLGQSSALRFSREEPVTVIMLIGVNGSGKTTSIAKIAYRLKQEGHKVLLAAADTFRSGAIDQLKEWGERIDVPVISQSYGADPGAVVYDAIQSALLRKYDVVLVDTAGRLATKRNLMEEMKKISNVVQKNIPGGPHEILLVIDATNGQNALLQARNFALHTGPTGVVLTKMDSSAKGGFMFAVVDDLGVPIKFIATGEKIEQLAPLEPHRFVEALFARD